MCFFSEQARGQQATGYLDRPLLPHVVIPTTWSGAELTAHFGMTDPSTRRKQGAGGPTCAPVAAVYDPAAVVGLDPQVSAASGMNCLAHGVECALSPSRTPEAEALALACVAGVASALPAVVDEPLDPDARAAMLSAAVLGGRCLQNATMGVGHGLSQLIGGRTGMPHGLANALVLAHAVRFDAGDPALYEPLERIGLALGDQQDPAGAIDRLRERLDLPGRLSECGMDEDDVDAVVRMSQSSPAVKGNARPVSEDEARELLEAAF